MLLKRHSQPGETDDGDLHEADEPCFLRIAWCTDFFFAMPASQDVLEELLRWGERLDLAQSELWKVRGVVSRNGKKNQDHGDAMIVFYPFNNRSGCGSEDARSSASTDQIPLVGAWHYDSVGSACGNGFPSTTRTMVGVSTETIRQEISGRMV